ncbi:MAG TPA: hypothetical protein PLP23_19650 [Panacibacter sp.]|nr:hypothetical protein [Panacibacter sp.]
MGFRIAYCWCFLLLLACSKNGNNTPQPPAYIDATGIWSVQSAIEKNNGLSSQYNSTDHPCLANNKYELKAGASGKYYFSGTDSCYLYKNGTTYVVAGVPGDEDSFTWQQMKDTVIVTYSVGKDTGIVNTANGKSYLTFTNHYSADFQYTVICTK